MGLLPGWVIWVSLAVLVLFVLVPLVPPLLSRRSRALSLLGSRYSLRNFKESFARGLPVALLVGIVLSSLSVGDGLLRMVEKNTDANLSGIDIKVSFPGFMDEDIGERAGLGNDPDVYYFAPVVIVDGLAAMNRDSELHGARIIGADTGIFSLSDITDISGADVSSLPTRYGVFINREAARVLGVERNDHIIIKIFDRGPAQESLLGYSADDLPTLNLTIERVIMNSGLGRYREDSLDRVEPVCILDRTALTERLGRAGEINSLLIDIENDIDVDAYTDDLRGILDRTLGPGDAGFSIESSNGGYFVHSSELFFHEEDLVIEDENLSLSYFVDSISTGSGDLSYSVVTGLSPPDTIGYENPSGQRKELSLLPGEVLVNNWTAERLGITPGESVVLRYRRVTELGTLIEGERYFTVADVVRMTGWANLTGYLPPIPGITEAPTCSDWDPSFDIDLDSLTDDDLEYWNIYRTTPKCFISMEDAREMWSVPSGDTTAVHISPGPLPGGEQELLSRLSGGITMSSVGGSVIPLRENALGSSRAMLIFPGMFFTFGTLIMAGSALVLYAVFKDLARKRAHEWGILRSIGAGSGGLFQMAFGESIWSIIIGALAGVPAGMILGAFLNLGLSSAWSEAVEGAGVPLAFTLPSIFLSVSLGVMVSVLIVTSAIKRETGKAPITNVRDTDPSVSPLEGYGRIRTTISALMLGVGGGAILFAGGYFEGYTSVGFFVLGSVMLSIGPALLLYIALTRVRDTSDLTLMVSANLGRRAGKNPLTVAVLAMMLTLSISLTFMGGMLEEDVNESFDSYGGGFDHVVETSIPFRGELPGEDSGAEFIPLLSVGKEGGTCSNINAPFPPRLLGAPEGFGNISDFSLVRRDGRFDSDREAWNSLGNLLDDRVPILVDQNTLQWIYFGSLGSEYVLESESGDDIELVVIGILSPSVLTGTFVMSASVLKESFPSLSVPTYFLCRSDIERSGIVDIFKDHGPVVSSVKELARENLDYELSYLYLFRDFLVFGLVVSMASAFIFTHTRAVRLREELATLRTMGVKRKRGAAYFVYENMAVFMISALGALVGSAASLLLFGPLIGGGSISTGSVGPGLLSAGAFIGTALAVSLGSAYTAVKDYGSLTRRN